MLVSQSRTGTSQKPPRPASPISIAFTEELASDDDEGDEHVRMLPSSTRDSSSLMHDFAPTPVLDNPDQTIADDVNKLSEQLSTTSVCRMAMNPIVPAVYAKEQREGDFRFNHVHVRTKAEAIAMMHSEFSEKQRLDTLLDVLVKVSYTVLRRNAPLNYCMRVTDYLGAVLSYLIISIPVFDGTFDDKTEAEITGLVSKNMFMCLYLIYQFSNLTNLSGVLAQLSGFTTRIALLLESCDSLEEEERQKRASTAIEALNLSRPPLPRTTPSQIQPPLLEVTHLICTTNLENPPLPLSFTVSDGQHTLISGRSGLGKSSLLRILSGIWDPPSSTSPTPFHFHPSLLVNAITTPNNHHHEFHPSRILFLPQTTLLVPTTPAPTGTSSAHYHHSSNALTPLLTQIAYPLHPSETDLSNARAEQILSLVGLSHVVDRCYETIQDESSGSDGFVESLSGGEKQRLALARIRKLAAENCAGLSKATDLHPVFGHNNGAAIKRLMEMIADHPLIAHDAISAMVNLSANPDLVPYFNNEGFVAMLVITIFLPDSVLADLCCMLLNNITKDEAIAKLLIPEVDAKEEEEKLKRRFNPSPI
ncbi:hypothetical protein HDU99_001500, partial [Rhizoclosmatium hyalinum]